MKNIVIPSALVLTLVSGMSWAGDGRIEISQSSLPLVITNSGSYVFTENVAVTNPGVHGIEVRANDVTIDLNGFTLTGLGTSSKGGICQTATNSNLTVINGTIRNWYYGGGAAGALSVEGGGAIRGVTATANQGNGIFARRSTIADCRAFGNMWNGIYGGNGSVVAGCESSGNSTGYSLKQSVVRDSAAISNANNGFSVNRSSMTACSSDDNGGAGVSASESSVEDSRFGGNANTGISAYDKSTVRSCQVVRNTAGGIVAYSSKVSDNTARSNVGASYAGIYADNQTVVIRNTASGNTPVDYAIRSKYKVVDLTGSGVLTNANPWANIRH